jgi:hypothetical protein
MIGDPFLNYFALGVLFFVVVVLFYGIIAIHDIPHLIAKSRDHPHQDAIHAAGWVSLFTLHALWPFLWIWAMAYKPDRGWGIHHSPARSGEAPSQTEIDTLRARLAAIESRLGIQVSSPTATVIESSVVSGNRPEIEAVESKLRGGDSSAAAMMIERSAGDRSKAGAGESKQAAGDR